MYDGKVTSVGSTDCIIVDAMAEIQILQVSSKTVTVTFVDMAEEFCEYTLDDTYSVPDRPFAMITKIMEILV